MAAVAAESSTPSSSSDCHENAECTLLLNRMAVLLRRMINAQVVSQCGSITIIADVDRARGSMAKIDYRQTNAYR